MNETADALAIERVWRCYADVVSRRAWPELDDLFVPDAVVDLHVAGRDPMQIVGPAAVGDFIADAISNMDFFQFVVLNHVVDIAADGQTATGRLWMSELRQFEGYGHFTQVWGLYSDTLVKTDASTLGGWRLQHRHYQTLARSAPDLELPT